MCMSGGGASNWNPVAAGGPRPDSDPEGDLPGRVQLPEVGIGNLVSWLPSRVVPPQHSLSQTGAAREQTQGPDGMSHGQPGIGREGEAGVQKVHQAGSGQRLDQGL